MEINRTLSPTVEGKRQSQSINQNSFDGSTPKRQLLMSEKVKQTLYINKHHTVGAFKVLQSLHKNGILCDIKLKTDDGTIVNAHKIILASISPYFRTIFTNFEGSNKNQMIIRELNSSALILLIDFIYTAQIMITQENVKELIPAANLLKLNDVRDTCCSFLQAQLQPTNCLEIMVFADKQDCTNLLSTSKSYILQNFSNVVEINQQSLSLTPEQVHSFISNDELTVPSEEKVYEYVIKWIYYDLNDRKKYLPKLMEHVRLPLISKEYFLKYIEQEPLIKNSLECKDYIIEALHYHLQMLARPNAIPKTIRTKPRGNIPKVFITFNEASTTKAIIKWYDSTTTKWHCGSEISIKLSYGYGFSVLNNKMAFFAGGKRCTNDSFELNTVYTLNLSLPLCGIKHFAPMINPRYQCGVACLNDCIYVFGGTNRNCFLNSAECFDFLKNQTEWQTISNMSTSRSNVGVGVLHNCIYVVGGKGKDNKFLKSVECYDPSTNTWTPVADMFEYRKDAGVGVLDGVVYAVGGSSKDGNLNSVEAYEQCTKVWTVVAPMNKKRRKPLVMAMDGLLYVFEGNDVEMYNPAINSWSI